jgi:hypothetical protein
LAVGGIFAAFTTINLPETCNERLPETLEEAENFGLNQPFFLVPFLEKRRKRKIEENDLGN